MNQTAIARSWVEHANGHSDFPLQNLPFCRFRLMNGFVYFFLIAIP